LHSSVSRKCEQFDVQTCPIEMWIVCLLVPYGGHTRCQEVSSPTSRQIVCMMARVQHCVDQWPAIMGNWIWKWCNGFCILYPYTIRRISLRCVFIYWSSQLKISHALNKKRQLFTFLWDRGVELSEFFTLRGKINFEQFSLSHQQILAGSSYTRCAWAGGTFFTGANYRNFCKNNYNLFDLCHFLLNTSSAGRCGLMDGRDSPTNGLTN
jgi:hypothetical protein